MDLNIKHELYQVYQQFNNDCVVACVATVTKNGYDKVRGVFDSIQKVSDSGYGIDEANIALIKLGYYPKIQRSDELLKDRIYMASVPSLNGLGKMHCVVIDCRDGEVKVYDPVLPLPEKRRFGIDSIENSDSNEPLLNWYDLVEIYKIP